MIAAIALHCIAFAYTILNISDRLYILRTYKILHESNNSSNNTPAPAIIEQEETRKVLHKQSEHEYAFYRVPEAG